MRPREVIAGLGLAAFMPLPAMAQALDRVRRLGLLMSYTENDQEGRERLAALREALRDAGWVDGGNTRLDVRWYAGEPEQAMVRARELVELAPDLIVVNGSPGVAALKRLTNTIPIVFVVVADPVGAGHVESLSRPGSNITGFSTFEPEIGGKWLEALKEAAPHIQRVGVVMDPNFPGFAALWRKIESVAPSSGLQAIVAYGRDGPEIDKAIQVFAGQSNGGLILLPTPINSVHRHAIFALTERHRLPAIYPFGFHARDGGLMAYGFDSQDLFRRAAVYVDRILKGARPAELPVQGPTKFELVINLKTARSIGLTIAPTLLARADEVIE